MAKFTKEQKDAVLQNFDSMIEEINKLVKTRGISDIEVHGFIIKPKNTNDFFLNCPCGVETFVDPKTGNVRRRCKKC